MHTLICACSCVTCSCSCATSGSWGPSTAGKASWPGPSASKRPSAAASATSISTRCGCQRPNDGPHLPALLKRKYSSYRHFKKNINACVVEELTVGVAQASRPAAREDYGTCKANLLLRGQS